MQDALWPNKCIPACSRDYEDKNAYVQPRVQFSFRESGIKVYTTRHHAFMYTTPWLSIRIVHNVNTSTQCNRESYLIRILGNLVHVNIHNRFFGYKWNAERGSKFISYKRFIGSSPLLREVISHVLVQMLCKSATTWFSSAIYIADSAIN